MSVRNLGFRDLQYLVSIAEQGSFGRAANACAITQPALSERIKRIEDDLGIEIFERNKRGMKVTTVGQRVVLKARELLDGASQLNDIVSIAHQPLSGLFRIGIIATLGPYLMPLILPDLRRKYPSLELVLQEGLTDSLIDALQSGTVDMVIAAAPLKASGIDQIELFYEPFILAVPIEHEMAKHKTVDASELCGEDMVLLHDGHCLSGQALDVCPAKQRRNHNRLHAMTLETLRHMVASGAGYTLLPFLAVGNDPQLSELIRYIPLAGKRLYGRKIVIVWRHTFNRKIDIEHLARMVRECLPAELQQSESLSIDRSQTK